MSQQKRKLIEEVFGRLQILQLSLGAVDGDVDDDVVVLARELAGLIVGLVVTSRITPVRTRDRRL